MHFFMEDSNSLTIVESFRLRKNDEIFFWMRSKTQAFPGTHVLDVAYTAREKKKVRKTNKVRPSREGSNRVK